MTHKTQEHTLAKNSCENKKKENAVKDTQEHTSTQWRKVDLKIKDTRLKAENLDLSF